MTINLVPGSFAAQLHEAFNRPEDSTTPVSDPAPKFFTPVPSAKISPVNLTGARKTPKKGSKMSAVVFPALPTELINTTDEGVQDFFLPSIEKTHARLLEYADTYEKVRESEANAEEALENSDSDNAQKFREVQEDATQATEQLDEKLAAMIKELKENHKAKIKEINDRLAVARKEAIEAETGAILEDVDLDELRNKFSTTLAAHIKQVKAVKEEVPQVVDYLKSLPTEVKMAKGNSRGSGSGSSGERGPTPRFVYAAVDGVQVEGAQTFSTVVKVLGIKASEGGRRLLADRLQGKVVTFDNVSFDIDSPTEFTVTTADGVVHTIAVVGKRPASADSEDAAA